MRVWSTDLYRDPAPEVVRVAAAVRDALRTAQVVSASDVTNAEVKNADVTNAVPDSAVVADSAVTPTPEASAPPAETPKRARRRVRRAATERSADDSDTGWGDRPRSGDDPAHERWLNEQRPPHWE